MPYKGRDFGQQLCNEPVFARGVRMAFVRKHGKMVCWKDRICYKYTNRSQNGIDIFGEKCDNKIYSYRCQYFSIWKA